MKKKSIVILILLIAVSTFAACGSTSKRESPGEFIDDSVITTKIKSLLAADNFLKSFEISVETRKGIVLLSGFVDNKETAAKAGEVARGVQGVRSVRNDLIVK